jgi:hypothetical protein
MYLSAMIKRLALPICIVLLVAMHLPFLKADPDGLLAWGSRGAYTDEGLYTSQVRNFINHGQFDINETDGVAKAPLFSAYLLPFFALLGTHLWVARLAILLFFAFTLYCFSRKHITQQYQPFAIGIIGLQYMVFTYSHFAMAEMLAASCIIWILYYYLAYVKTGSNIAIAYATLFGMATVLVKTNHLYVVGILPTVLGITLLLSIIKSRIAIRQNAVALGLSIGTTIASALLTFLIVYLPNKALYQKIYNQEVSGKFEPTFTQLIDRASFNWSMIANAPVLVISIIILVVALLLLLLSRSTYFKGLAKHEKPYQAILFCFVWLIIELHKLPVLNLPSRYLVATFLAISMLTMLLLEQLAFTHLKRIGLIISILLVFIGIVQTVQASGRRSFVIKELNAYVANKANPNRVMLGTWAATACWESKNITMPVWENYFNDHGFMEKHHPQAIITEFDERDAGYIFTKRGVDLKALSDSTHDFKIEEWQVRVSWLKN